MADASRDNAPVIGRTDFADGCYIETLIDKHTGEPMYRSCSPGGAICRYSSDLWQAQVYVEYFRSK